MYDSIDDVFRAIRRRDGFKLRYSTRGSAATECKIPYYEWVATNDFHASLRISTTSREDIGDVTRWKFDAEYEFGRDTYNLTQAWTEEGERCIYELIENHGGGSARTTGYLEAGKDIFFDSREYVYLHVFIDPEPLKSLMITHHEKSDSYSGVGEETVQAHHKIFFELIRADEMIVSPFLNLPGFGFRRMSFKKFRAWEAIDWMCGSPRAPEDLRVIQHQEIAMTDGNELPTLDDCVPLIEVVEEQSRLPVAGKAFKIKRPDGAPSTHVTDAKGQIKLFVEDDDEFEVVEMEEHPERGEPHHWKTEP